jgi:hypothetical protein
MEVTMENLDMFLLMLGFMVLGGVIMAPFK